MNPRRKSRLSIIIFVILGISIATGLVLYALRQNIDLFYTPSEVVEGKDGNPDQKPEVGQRIRVGGMVVEGSVSRDPKSLKVRFDVNDIGPSITVEYEGILPDLFRIIRIIRQRLCICDHNKYIIKISRILKLYPTPQRSNIMSHMELSCRTITGKHNLFHILPSPSDFLVLFLIITLIFFLFY